MATTDTTTRTRFLVTLLDGSYLAIKEALTPEQAIASLISERGYSYYTPEWLKAEQLPPLQYTDAFGNSRAI